MTSRVGRSPRPSVIVAAAAALGVAWAVASPAMAQTVRDSRSAEVDQVFSQWDRTHRPGAAVVVLRDGEILHMDGYGMADLDQGVPITPSTVFDIASVSKHFTGWAVAGLEAQGRLSVDDPIDQYLPEIPTFGETITVWHLLHHTSGIRDWVELFAVAGWRFDDAITVPDVITLARHQEALNFRPGTAYAYSNTAYNLLAEIVARVSGTSFREYMEEHAFRPLGMSSTHVHDTYNEQVPNRARSYAPVEVEEGEEAWELWVNNTSAVGSSSVFTTVSDMARWMDNLDRGAVGGRERLELMRQPTVLENGDTVSYGYGLSLGEHRGLRTVSHGGGWRGYRTHLLRFPEEGLSVAVFANFSTFPSFETAARVAEVYLADRMAPPATEEDEDTGSSTFFEERDTAAVPISADALTAYEGRYFSEELGTFYTMEREGDRLMARHRINEDQATTHMGDDTFVMPGVRGEQTLRFIRDGGEVTGYTLEGRRFKGIVFRKMPE